MKPDSNGAVQDTFQHDILLLQWSNKMGHGMIRYLWAMAVQLQHHVLYDCSKLNKHVLQNTSRHCDSCSFSHNCQSMSSKILSCTNLCANQQVLDSRVLIISPDTQFTHDPIQSMRGIKMTRLMRGKRFDCELRPLLELGSSMPTTAIDWANMVSHVPRGVLPPRLIS